LTNRNDYFDAVRNVSNGNKFNPVREVLDALIWDGQEHIRGLLPGYLGAEDSDYNYEVIRLFMLGAISRIYEPGCKFDYCLILSGKQGIGKSSFLQKLALSDCWFSDSLDSLDGDRAVQSLIGVWIVELAELKSLARTSGGDESVKRFISARQDRLRIPYERRFETFQRSCVFAGTTNRVDFLTDTTGNRRFLVVAVGEHEPTMNLFEDAATDEIKLAWAQAVRIYKSEHPRLTLPEYVQEQAEQAQDASLVDNGMQGIIEEYLSEKNRTCVIDVWRNALGKDGQPKRFESNEIVSTILNLQYWKREPTSSKFGEYGKQRCFRKELVSELTSENTSNQLDATPKTDDGFVSINENSPFDEVSFE
jgi:predicted P-loop ATPase